MLIFLVYLFAAVGITMLMFAIVIKLKLAFPLKDRTKLIAAAASFNMKFPHQFINHNHTCIIAYNEHTNTIVIGTYNPRLDPKVTASIYPYSDISGCELIENALTIKKVSKTCLIEQRKNVTNIEPAKVTYHKEEITELILKIYIKSLVTPVIQISFLPKNQLIKKTDTSYINALADAHQCYQILKRIVMMDSHSEIQQRKTLNA